MVNYFRKKLHIDKSSGFTLIEVMLVVMIIGLLAGLVVVNVSSTTRRAVVTACKIDWKIVDNAVKAYQIDNQKNPLPPTSNLVLTAEDFYGSDTSSPLFKNGYMGLLKPVVQAKSSYKIGVIYKTFPAYNVVVNDFSLSSGQFPGATGTENDCDLIP